MNLAVFSEKDIKYVPYELPTNARIDLSALLKHDFTKTLLVYKRIRFQIWTKDTEIIFRKGDRLFSCSEAAYFIGPRRWCFKNENSGEAELIEYMVIALNPKLTPPPIMDVAFFHEMREMYYLVICKFPGKISHRKARKDERKYVKKFLSPTEKQIYKNFFINYRPIIKELGEKETKKIIKTVNRQKEEKDENSERDC